MWKGLMLLLEANMSIQPAKSPTKRGESHENNGT